MPSLPPNLTHPGLEQLRGFVTSQLAGNEMAILRNHLRICSECQDLVQRLRNNDPVGETRNENADALATQTKPLGAIKEEANANLPIPAALARHSRYKVLNLLGAGGMGTIYRAVDSARDQYVAVKVLHVCDRQAIGRFQREVELLSKLSHTNLVSFYEANLAGDQPYIVMECVEGLSLDRILTRKGLLKVADACEIIRQVALGLQHAHDQQIIHRDIKPSNIMVTPEGNVKLLDWGLGRIWEETTNPEIFLTMANQTLGTPDYIAPETLQNSHQADHLSDIYSLGGSLFTLLTGMPPRDWRNGNGQTGVLKKPDSAMNSVRRDTKPGLRRLVNQMLHKNRHYRPRTAAAVAEALAPYCVGANLTDLYQPTNTYRALGKPVFFWERVIVWAIILVLFFASLSIVWLK
jgi:serine/threonine-protein kinase